MTPDVKQIQKIIDQHHGDKSALITVLQDLQRKFNYIPPEGVTATAKALDVPLSKVYSVATFYSTFSLVPRGEKIIRICQGTACHIKGADLIQEQIEAGLNIKAGETSSDMKYTLEVVNCVGVCAMAPAVLVNDKMHGNVRCEKALKLVK
ncbi:MAG: NADH-quinone oxidoreductase subunit NuoE [candidate division Zixibacteria bacterium]|nr:NADH-quinone oxidoreductase subunit NuoE [candidate division Zixibacteria bacterium]